MIQDVAPPLPELTEMVLFSIQKSNSKPRLPKLSLGWSQAPRQPRHGPSVPPWEVPVGRPAGQQGGRGAHRRKAVSVWVT